MLQAIQIIKQIKNTQGTHNKEGILTKNADDKALLTLLQLAFNPFITFGITEFPKKLKTFEGNQDHKFDEFITLTNKLSQNSINAASLEEATLFLQSLDTQTQEVYSAILTKSLSIGIAAKSINKVIPNLIPTFDCMLASSDGDFSFPCLVQEKLDGVRCIIIKKDGKITAFTRQGREIPIKRLANILIQFPNDNIVLDGELLMAGELRQDTSGKINSLIKTGYKAEIDNQLEYFVFDIMTLEEWVSRTTTLLAFERAVEVQAVVSMLGSPFKEPAQKFASFEEDIFKFYKEIRDAGGEGVIIKTNTMYEWKRSKNWRKLKAICSCTLEIEGFTEGTGKNEGKVGAVSCKSSDGLLRVNVNPKTDEIRDYITDNIERLSYQKIEVLFNELIIAKDDTYSLFLPRMADNWLRVDKACADTLPEIIKESRKDGSI